MCRSQIEVAAVVTRSVYIKHGFQQTIWRWLEDSGDTYHVLNELQTKPGTILQAHLYFDKV